MISKYKYYKNVKNMKKVLQYEKVSDIISDEGGHIQMNNFLIKYYFNIIKKKFIVYLQ